jgi:hypothetical protein
MWTQSEATIIDRWATLLEKLFHPPAQPQQGPRNFGSGTATNVRPPHPSRHHESDEEMARRLQDEENRRATSGVRTRFEAYEGGGHEAPQPSVARAELSTEELRRRRMARFQNT